MLRVQCIRLLIKLSLLVGTTYVAMSLYDDVITAASSNGAMAELYQLMKDYSAKVLCFHYGTSAV